MTVRQKKTQATRKKRGASKTSGAARGRKRRSRRVARLDVYDDEPLKSIDLKSKTAIQPGWISERFEAYAHDHGMQHELSSVREIEHDGNSIKITTTYQVEVNGERVNLHAIVGNDGSLHCHTTPYTRYASAVDLVRGLIDRYPSAFPTPNGRTLAKGGSSHRHEGKR